jgi:hypothetical protein
MNRPNWAVLRWLVVGRQSFPLAAYGRFARDLTMTSRLNEAIPVARSGRYCPAAGSLKMGPPCSSRFQIPPALNWLQKDEHDREWLRVAIRGFTNTSE